MPEVLPTKQPFWDSPVVLADKALVEASLNSPYSRASFLAACHQHSGDWLFAMPIASCGLKLDNEAVRVAVGLRLGLDFCVPHECHCGFRVDAYGVHSFVCKRAPGKTSRHHAFNDLIVRGFSSASQVRSSQVYLTTLQPKWQNNHVKYTIPCIKLQYNTI